MVAECHGAFAGMETFSNFARLGSAVDTEELDEKFLFARIDIAGIDDRFIEFLGRSEMIAVCADNRSALGFGTVFRVNRGDIPFMECRIEHNRQKNDETEHENEEKGKDFF
jgi:hypothetical protein